MSDYTLLHFRHHDCTSTHSTSWSCMPQVLALVHSGATVALLFYSPGEVVVFQCVELLREHLEEKLLHHQGSSGEEEQETECLAGNIAVCK